MDHIGMDVHGRTGTLGFWLSRANWSG